MNFTDYQKEAIETAVYGAGDKIIYPALGLANEAGEVLGKIKKVLRDSNGDFNESNRAEIAKEMGDVQWYLAALAQDIGWDLGQIAIMNIQKLKDRKSRDVIQGSGDNR